MLSLSDDAIRESGIASPSPPPPPHHHPGTSIRGAGMLNGAPNLSVRADAVYERLHAPTHSLCIAI
eukprot:3777519-Rhodomonas_salina.3